MDTASLPGTKRNLWSINKDLTAFAQTPSLRSYEASSLPPCRLLSSANANLGTERRACV
jgi:hypothetical protein